MGFVMNMIKSVLIGFVLSVFSASAIAEEDVCAPFKDGVVDESIVSKMLAAAKDGHLYRIKPSSSKVGFCVDSPIGMVEGEFKDFTGIIYRIPALNFPIMFKRGTFRMTVGIAGWDIEAVEHFGLVHKIFRDFQRQLGQQSCHDMSPCFLFPACSYWYCWFAR